MLLEQADLDGQGTCREWQNHSLIVGREATHRRRPLGKRKLRRRDNVSNNGKMEQWKEHDKCKLYRQTKLTKIWSAKKLSSV